MLPHYVEAYKAADEGRAWAEEEEQADTGVERVSGAWLVCQSPSVPPHTHTRFPDHLSPHFETFKMRLSKRSMPDRLLQPPSRMRRTNKLLVRRAATTKSDGKSHKLTDARGAFKASDIYTARRRQRAGRHTFVFSVRVGHVDRQVIINSMNMLKQVKQPWQQIPASLECNRIYFIYCKCYCVSAASKITLKLPRVEAMKLIFLGNLA